MNSSLSPRKILQTLCIPAMLWPATFVMSQPLPPAVAPQPQPAETLTQTAPKPVGVLAGRPDAEPTTELLAARYENKSSGISFRPPLDTKEIPLPSGDEIVEFVNESKSWMLRVSKPTFPSGVPLSTSRNKAGIESTGLLEYTVQQLKVATPGAKILRQDVINVDSSYVGMIALRFTMGSQRWLRQQAIFQVNDRLYYILNLTTPAGKINAGDDEEKIPPDPSEKKAVDTFVSMIDSIKLIDRRAIKDDQDQRLFRTRSLFLYWTPAKFDAIRVERQYLRIVQDGKDVGYRYVEEMPNDPKLSGVDGPGAVVYERSHRVDKDEQGRSQFTDIGAFKFMSFDRKRERWTRTVVMQTQTDKGPEETHSTEYADGKEETKLIYSPNLGVVPKNDEKAPPMRPAISHTLDLTFIGKTVNAEPLHIDLPPFYLPQAGLHMLPRLVIDKSFRGPRTYLFAGYASDSKDIRMRYVDVSEENEVMFAGQRVQAITVSERVGMEGSATVHYVTVNGRLLGTENKSLKLLILPTDEATILKLWPDAKLTRPDKMQRDNKPAVSELPQDPAPVRGLPATIR